MKKYSLFFFSAAFLLLSASMPLSASSKQNTPETPGEIIASNSKAIAQTQSGQVAGYIENGVYIYKGIPYAKAERFMPPTAPDSWEGIRSSRAYGPTCPQAKRTGWYSDESAFSFNWTTVFPMRTACVSTSGRRAWATGRNAPSWYGCMVAVMLPAQGRSCLLTTVPTWPRRATCSGDAEPSPERAGFP